MELFFVSTYRQRIEEILIRAAATRDDGDAFDDMRSWLALIAAAAGAQHAKATTEVTDPRLEVPAQLVHLMHERTVGGAQVTCLVEASVVVVLGPLQMGVELAHLCPTDPLLLPLLSPRLGLLSGSTTAPLDLFPPVALLLAWRARVVGIMHAAAGDCATVGECACAI